MKWLESYEENFKKDYRTKIPFLKLDDKDTAERAQKRAPQSNQQTTHKTYPLQIQVMKTNTTNREVETPDHLPS